MFNSFGIEGVCLIGLQNKMRAMKCVFQIIGLAVILTGCQTIKPMSSDVLSDRRAELESRLNALDMDDPNLRFSKVESRLREDGFGDDDFKVLADFGNSNAQVLYGRQFRLKDDQKSRDYYKRACEAGNMFGCRAMGFSFKNSMNVEKTIIESDYDAARPYFEKACDAGNALSCRALGNLYHFNHGVKEDVEKARRLYEKSCDLGNYFGCNDLGALYMYGRDVEQDFDKARTLFEYACEGARLGCLNLQNVEKRMKRTAK